jgi:hypothetical protein
MKRVKSQKEGITATTGANYLTERQSRLGENNRQIDIFSNDY